MSTNPGASPLLYEDGCIVITSDVFDSTCSDLLHDAKYELVHLHNIDPEKAMSLRTFWVKDV